MNNTDWELDELLRELVRRNWTLYCFGPRDQPEALSAVCRSESFADVVILRGHDRAAAYRAPLLPGGDPLTPDVVIWHYLSSPVWTLRAVLSLTLPDTSLPGYRTPAECRVPEAERRPYTTRHPRYGYPDAPARRRT